MKHKRVAKPRAGESIAELWRHGSIQARGRGFWLVAVRVGLGATGAPEYHEHIFNGSKAGARQLLAALDETVEVLGRYNVKGYRELLTAQFAQASRRPAAGPGPAIATGFDRGGRGRGLTLEEYLVRFRERFGLAADRAPAAGELPVYLL